MDIIKNVFSEIWNLGTDQIAILSLAITLLLFVLGKRSENRIKMYETRKEEYQKFIDFFKDMLAHSGSDTSAISENADIKKIFIDVGSSLSIYGSRKLYKTYCFYRALALDERIKASRWYSQDMLLYSLGEMYKIMRKEIGLNRNLLSIDVPDLLSYYITDFTKPDFKKKYYAYHFNKIAIKTTILICKIEDCLPFYWFANYIIKPIFFILFCIIRFPIKLFIITPFQQLKKVIK